MICRLLCAFVVLATAISASGGHTLSLMSYNVRHCSGVDDRIDCARTAEAIMKENPDFAGLQEVDVKTSRSGKVDQSSELSRLTGMHATFAKAIDYKGGEYGVAVLSRDTPLSVVRKPLPGPEPRVLLLCEFTDCWFGTTHLDSGVCKGDTEPAHILSVPIISNAVVQCASGGKPVFLTGDWNAVPKSRLVGKMRTFLRILSDTTTPTTSDERRTIDYITVDSAHSGRVKVKKSRIVPDRETSDHKSVAVYVEMPESVKWTGDGRRPPASDEAFYAERPASEFRSSFVCPRGAPMPPLRMAAAGYYTLMVNGRAPDASAAVSLMPLWSPFDKTVYVDEHPLPAEILKPWPETNEVRVILGNGFYNLPPLRFWGCHKFRNALASGESVFSLSADGVGFSAWKWRETDIVRNCVYLGTEVDRTRTVSGTWRPAVAAEGPKGRLVTRKAPPVGIRGVLKGRSKWLREGFVQVVDFGENNTGVPSFLFHAKRGTRIEIVYGERLNADGSVNVLTQTAGQIKKRGKGGPGAPDVAEQRDMYVCSGAEEGERFTPPFTWHVCRYAEVRGLGTLLGSGDAELRLVSSLVADAKPGAELKTGDGDLDRIHDMCRRTFLANLVGVQSDCPGRERLGYGGDIVATCEAYCLNFDMREFYLKTLQDFADEASGDGWITETAPYVGIATKGFGGRSGPVSWALAVPVLMDALLRHYGDERALDYYDTCARYVRLVAAKCPNGIVERCIGDHEALGRAPDSLVATAHWHEFLRLTASFAERLGREKDAAEFCALAEKTKAAFVERWVKEDGTVGNGTQSAQAIGVYLGLVPESLRDAAFAKLVAAVEANDCAPATGIFATRYMLMALSENGRVDLARRIVLRKGFPGWLHMLDRGATTLWETWRESDGRYSNCHPMFGSVDEWIVRFSAMD